MRRYRILFMISFVLLIVLFSGNIYMSGYAGKAEDKTLDSITVYTTLPSELSAVLAGEYEKSNKIKVNFVHYSQDDLLSRMKARHNVEADVVMTDQEVFRKLEEQDKLSKYTSEYTDVVSKRLKDEDGSWVGVWYDPIVFCANRDYLLSLPHIPLGWHELAADNSRLGITDFLAADASANLLFTFVAEKDEQWTFDLLKQYHPRIVQYSKYLASPVRMAGMGEVDIAIAVQSETIRYRNEGFPISVIYPREGTAYMLTGAGVIRSSSNKEQARAFVDWLLQDDVQLALQKNKFYFVPANYATIAYKAYTGKDLKLFDQYSILSGEERRAVLDRWVKEVRFN